MTVTSELHRIDLLVIDVLMDGIENLEDVVRLLNNPLLNYAEINDGQPFRRDEVSTSVLRLCERGYAEPMTFTDDELVIRSVSRIDKPIEEYWFRLTPKGRAQGKKFPWEPA
jgi:hypothetical protein